MSEDGGGIEGNLNFNLGEGDLSGNNLTLIRTDHGATSRALDAIDNTARAAFGFAGEALDDVRGFGSDAIDAVRDNSRAGFDFANDALDKSLDTVGDFGISAIKSVESNSNNTLDAFSDLLDNNLAHLSTTQANALTAINKATRSDNALALESLAKTGGFALAAIVAGFVLITKFSR